MKLDVADKTGPGGLIVLVGVSAEELPVSSLELIEWRTNGEQNGLVCLRIIVVLLTSDQQSSRLQR